MQANGTMTKQQGLWDDGASGPQPMHLGVQLLWSVILGYALMAAVPALLGVDNVHLVGATGALAAALITVRRNDRTRHQLYRSKDRPHDGWIG